MKHFGIETILDLHNCDPKNFTRENISNFMVELCDAIHMEREDLHFWDYEGVPESERPTEEHLLGTSAVQFITTSNITIHTLDLLGHVYLNIFSCKEYDPKVVVYFATKYFGGEIINELTLRRL